MSYELNHANHKGVYFDPVTSEMRVAVSIDVMVWSNTNSRYETEVGGITRPLSRVVRFIGPTDPGALANDLDEWINIEIPADEPEVTFLFRDDFTTADTAPITTPRTAEPGPGALHFVSPTYWSATDGKLVLDKPTTGGSEGTGAIYQPDGETAFTMAPGLALIRAGWLSSHASPGRHGWSNFRDGNSVAIGATRASANVNAVESATALATFVAGAAVAVDTAIIALDTAYVTLIRPAGETDWRPLWRARATPSASHWMLSATNLSGTAAVTSEWTTQRITNIATLDATWASTSKIIANETASPSANAIITGEAEAPFELIFTAALDTTYDFMFARVDDDNCLIARVTVTADGTNSTVKIIEVVSGSETERSSNTVTITAAQTIRLWALGYESDGSKRATLQRAINSTFGEQTSASIAGAFTFGTTAKTSHAATEMVAYKRSVAIPVGVL